MRKQITAVGLLAFISLLFFFKTLPLGFFSDDFYVMHRLVVKNQFWLDGFFRPLSDLSLLINYYLSGYEAMSYRLTNLLLHTACSFLLYKTLLNFSVFSIGKDRLFAFTAALLFVVYPYHTETITWIVGRAAILANFFGILMLYFYSCQMPYAKKMLLMAGCFFIGLLSYESIMVLPGCIFVVEYARSKQLKQAMLYVVPLAIALAIHFVLRKLISGVIFGNYGVDMFIEEANYPFNFIKSVGRLFIPGMHSSLVFASGLSVICLLIAVSFYTVYRYRKSDFNKYCLLWLMLLLAQLIPTMFGVDTHTSDGERMLYLPSYFLCIILAFLLQTFIQSQKTMAVVLLAITGACGWMQMSNIQHWIKADAGIKQIIDTFQKTTGQGKQYIINLPESEEGSFMFRNGFYEALQIHGVDTQNIELVNTMRTYESIQEPAVLSVQRTSHGYHIPYQCNISETNIQVLPSPTLRWKEPEKNIDIVPGSQIFYWNKQSLVRWR